MDTREEIMEETRDVAGFPLTRLAEFPRIALYMEQVTSFFEDIMQHVRLRAGEKLLTKTMINNYAKEGTLHRPLNKKYDRSHLVKLVYIFLLKRVLSMQDIKRMFDMLEHDNTLETMYECLLDEIDQSRAEYEEHVARSINRSEALLRERGLYTQQNVKLLVMMRLGVEATADQAIVARLIDACETEDK